MKKRKLMALALKAAAEKVAVTHIDINEIVDGEYEENDAHIYLATEDEELAEQFAIALTHEIFDNLGYKPFWIDGTTYTIRHLPIKVTLIHVTFKKESSQMEKTVSDYIFESRGKKVSQLKEKLLLLGFEVTDFSYIVKHSYDEYGSVTLTSGKTVVKFVTEQEYQWREPKCHLYVNDYCVWESPEPLKFTELMKKIKKFRKEGL